MFSNNMHLEFLGFEPKDYERNAIGAIVDKIQSLAPSGAFTKVDVRKGLGLTRVSCQIRSLAGSFVATAAAADPIAAARKAGRLIDFKLREWKKRRFSHADPEVGLSAQ